ncbi:MAG: alpha-D-ribose 1-methylphosphonate 5-triphosphate diphosphatase [Xanthobacteraceae bacterium]|nr:alpha-D-ribose 1-methylphosphonate 5-triphosphate diphosphatase [Xanthobacteraceae bacterium]
MIDAKSRSILRAPSSHLRIDGGRVLVGDHFETTSIDLEGELIRDVGRDGDARRVLDADGLMVLPGIVDIHGDAFERQMMPRPGVHFPLDVTLLDTDRQVIANGITTVFHGVTWSWEPGLRGPENARAFIAAIEALRPQLHADTRFHLRHETYNLDAEAEVMQWIEAGRIGMLAFNNHVPDLDSSRPGKVAQMAERCGLPLDRFTALVRRVSGRAKEVPDSIRRLAAQARVHAVPLLSHDDASPEVRRRFRALGCRVAEFPITIETAQDAAMAGDDIVLGAPNVVRGGSHIGWINAADMIGRGLCTVLASDYYYPAQILAAFRLVADDVVPFARAWSLISERPALAAGLPDRGAIAPGRRADVILVDASASRSRVVAAIVAGRMAHLTDASRLS